jgi:hypothetical protein
MSDRDRKSVEDGSDGWEILSAMNRDHGWLSVLAMESCEDVKKGERGLWGTTHQP